MTNSMTRRTFELLAAAPYAGSLVEFGVCKGAGLVSIAKLAQNYLREVPPIYGFDSFEGMPPTQAPLEGYLVKDCAGGAFGDTNLEAVQQRLEREGVQATLVKGVFSELRPLRDYGIDRVRLAHIDADIYEGYRDALRLLNPHLAVGSVLLFDEIIPPNEWRYESVRDHGQCAVREWEATTNFHLHLIRFEWTVALCVIVDGEYLKRCWRAIDRLRKDTVEESLKKIARRLTGRKLEARRHPDYVPVRRRLAAAVRRQAAKVMQAFRP